MRTLVIRWFENGESRLTELSGVQSVDTWLDKFLCVTCGDKTQRNYSLMYFPLDNIFYMEFIETSGG